MRTIVRVSYHRPVLDHPGSITSNPTARLNTTQHRLTTTPGITIGRPDCLFEAPNQPHPKALPSNWTGNVAKKTIVTALNPHKTGQRHS
jgi:hypothetical protein